MAQHSLAPAIRRRPADTPMTWLVLAALFAVTGAVNIGLAVSSATVWPAVLAVVVFVATAGCARSARSVGR
jgi:hypothetical protein